MGVVVFADYAEYLIKDTLTSPEQGMDTLTCHAFYLNPPIFPYLQYPSGALTPDFWKKNLGFCPNYVASPSFLPERWDAQN